MGLGVTEIAIIAVIGMLLFGPKQLPKLGRSVGEAIRSFKDGIAGLDEKPSEKEKASQKREELSSNNTDSTPK